MKKRKYRPPEDTLIRAAITGDIDALFELRAHYDKLMRYKLNKEIKIMAEKFDLDLAWFGFDDLLGDMGVIFDNAVMSFRD